jgi:hypothetical protein
MPGAMLMHQAITQGKGFESDVLPYLAQSPLLSDNDYLPLVQKSV